MHIIFDLDGTLIDSKQEILKTYRAVFAEIPPVNPVQPEDLDYGMNINDLLLSVYGPDKELIACARRMFASIYDHSDYTETTLYEGVYDTLVWLKEQGHRLYIATNKRFTPTMRILELKDMRHFFDYVVAYEMTPGVAMTKREMIASLKSSGSFSEGIMVGDSLADIQAGKDEQLQTIAVLYGYESAHRLAEKKPDYLIDRFYNLSTFAQLRKGR